MTGKIDADLVAFTEAVFFIGRRLKLAQRIHWIGLQLRIGRRWVLSECRRAGHDHCEQQDVNDACVNDA